ncbi:MAG TPA: hypothetical protein VIW67_04230 [Terriglobales bacterium]
MGLKKLVSVTSRFFFFGAYVLLGLALIERIANTFGYTVLQKFRGGRLLEFAVVFLVFVIAIQLREISEDFKKRA